MCLSEEAKNTIGWCQSQPMEVTFARLNYILVPDPKPETASVVTGARLLQNKADALNWPYFNEQISSSSEH